MLISLCPLHNNYKKSRIPLILKILTPPRTLWVEDNRPVLIILTHFLLFLNSMYRHMTLYICLPPSLLEYELYKVRNCNSLVTCGLQTLKQCLTYSRLAYTYWMNDCLTWKEFWIKLTLGLRCQSVQIVLKLNLFYLTSKYFQSRYHYVGTIYVFTLI